MRLLFELAQKFVAAYHEACKPLCRELAIPQTAFDILLFLANNPEYQTARDIVEVRRIKANLVSVNVDRLVREGYLTREALNGDRRKTRLVCTEKATPIVERGRQMQERFFQAVLTGVAQEQQEAVLSVFEKINENLDETLADRSQQAKGTQA